MWQTMASYDFPKTAWDMKHPKALFYSEKTGIVVGICLLINDRMTFHYESEGWGFEPTHWMPLPPKP